MRGRFDRRSRSRSRPARHGRSRRGCSDRLHHRQRRRRGSPGAEPRDQSPPRHPRNRAVDGDQTRLGQIRYRQIDHLGVNRRVDLTSHRIDQFIDASNTITGIQHRRGHCIHRMSGVVSRVVDQQLRSGLLDLQTSHPYRNTLCGHLTLYSRSHANDHAE
jgi:hypothetical protein